MATPTSADERRTSPKHPDSAPSRPATAPKGHQKHPSNQWRPLPATHEEQHRTPSTSSQTHRNFVLPDFVALRYLSSCPSTRLVTQRTSLTGYTVHVVEQWTTSRTHPTFAITTFTGDPSNVIVVGVLAVPADETTWSPRLRVYFKALNQHHARRRETELGLLMVTNLTGFPSSLTVITVPDGDLSAHRVDFFVAEDLKRLNCSGRVGLTLAAPSQSTVAKFQQLYRTSEKNAIEDSVLELVRLCQTALGLFGCLDASYTDGLLCDYTERALSDWWVDVGSAYYSIDAPHDGILGPTTVAGLLGLLMGARNRLHAINAPVGKDPFNVEEMRRGIGGFQKNQRIPRTRRLDRRTLERLHKATVRAAEHERWTVLPKVLKNTAAEISGKGGEMLAEASGRRDKAGIAEIETCDLERFVELLYGERARWLWRGKPLKKYRLPDTHSQDHNATETGTVRGDSVGISRNLAFTQDEQGGFAWTAKRMNTSETLNEAGEPGGTPGDTTDEEGEKGGLLKRAVGLPKAGLGIVRGAVGLRSHHQANKQSTDLDTPRSPNDGAAKRPEFRRSYSSPQSSGPNSPRSPTTAATEGKLDVVAEHQASKSSVDLQREKKQPQAAYPNVPFTAIGEERQARDSLDVPRPDDATRRSSGDSARSGGSGTVSAASEPHSPAATHTPSIAGSWYKGVDLNEVLPSGPKSGREISKVLRRRVSMSRWTSAVLEQQQGDGDGEEISGGKGWPRHLSFSLAEESVLTWSNVADAEDEESTLYDDEKAQLEYENLLAAQAQKLRYALAEITETTSPWTSTQLSVLQSLLAKANHDADALEALHGSKIADVKDLQGKAEGVLRQERERAEEGVREIETLGAKLEYEIEGLRQRVQDVESGVGDFGKGVERVEERVGELERDIRRGERGWGVCGVM